MFSQNAKVRRSILDATVDTNRSMKRKLNVDKPNRTFFFSFVFNLPSERFNSQNNKLLTFLLLKNFGETFSLTPKINEPIITKANTVIIFLIFTQPKITQVTNKHIQFISLQWKFNSWFSQLTTMSLRNTYDINLLNNSNKSAVLKTKQTTTNLACKIPQQS